MDSILVFYRSEAEEDCNRRRRPVVLCDTSFLVQGLNWDSDNAILYGDILSGGIKRVSADGGTPESLTNAKLANIGKEGVPLAPQTLPDRKTLLFTNVFDPTSSTNAQITVQSLESGEPKVLVSGFGARYIPTGHLVYLQENMNVWSIVAVPFNLEKLEITGGPVPLIEGIWGGAFSDSGTLVYVSHRRMPRQPHRTDENWCG